MSPEQLRQRAVKALEEAEQSTSIDAADSWLRIAAAWSQMANDLDRRPIVPTVY